MAEIIKMPLAGYFGKFNETVLEMPGNWYEPTFNSTLERNWNSDKNWTLRITLRLFFKQIHPLQLTSEMWRAVAAGLGIRVQPGVQAGVYNDSDDDPHLIKEWSASDWTNFINAVNAQASLWDGKFWLIPPDDFSHFDIEEGSWTNKSGKLITRPNIKCEFNLEITPVLSMAHGLIEVVNLLGPGFFRSASRLYNTSDVDIRTMTKFDFSSQLVQTRHPVIAHEIGHALGLPHIGVSRNLGLCNLAVVWGSMPDDAIPAIYKGGSNSSVCYGSLATADDLNDIMGVGAVFGPENAKPWLNRLLFHHLNLSRVDYVRMMTGYTKWKVSLTEPRPRIIPTP